MKGTSAILVMAIISGNGYPESEPAKGVLKAALLPESPWNTWRPAHPRAEDLPSCFRLFPDTIKSKAYDSFKQSVMEQKSTFRDSSAATIAAYFFPLVNDSLYAYWQGTPWDFNGTTRRPGQGTIACGYFVTNTLSDLGFRIERVKLAQSVSSRMIHALCTDIHQFAGFEKFQSYMKAKPGNSAYIVGLDYHTGYIVKDQTGCYFFHSNYYDSQGVVKERIEDSRALLSSQVFMIGSLTANSNLLEKWTKE